MKQRTSSLPMVVVIAVIALVLGSIGTAVAAPALTKGKVKKIATKVVKKEAPTLAVASAATAGTATSAGNATNLNGQPSTTYLDRVATTSASAAAPVAVAALSEVQVLGPLSLTVPAGVNFAHVTGTVTLAGGGPSDFYVYAAQDVACGAAGPGITNRVFSEYNAQSSATFDFVFPVTAGVHTYRLCVLNNTPTGAYNRSLTVETVATGATGGSTITKPSDGGAPAGSDASLGSAD